MFTNSDFDDHHIIPQKLASDRVLSALGFNIDAAIKALLRPPECSADASPQSASYGGHEGAPRRPLPPESKRMTDDEAIIAAVTEKDRCSRSRASKSKK